MLLLLILIFIFLFSPSITSVIIYELFNLECLILFVGDLLFVDNCVLSFISKLKLLGLF